VTDALHLSLCIIINHFVKTYLLVSYNTLFTRAHELFGQITPNSRVDMKFCVILKVGTDIIDSARERVAVPIKDATD
jgi:hypothetical protein